MYSGVSGGCPLHLERELLKQLLLLEGRSLLTRWDFARAGQHLELLGQVLCSSKAPLDWQQAGVVNDQGLALGLSQ